jgi:dihydrofolate reductase
MQIVLVAAIGENNVIGREGQLPWRLKSDLQHFKRRTLNRPVVMGRRTYESIGKPLKDRTNIVVTRSLGVIVPGGVLATSLDAALAIARDDAIKRGVDEIMVIGGSDVFSDTIDRANRLEITHVHASPPGDSFFPPIDPTVWAAGTRREYSAGPGDDADFSVVTYTRR